MTEYTVTDRREFAGRLFKARTNGGGACVYLPTDAIRDTDVFMFDRWYFHGEVRHMASSHQLSRTANRLVNGRFVDVATSGTRNSAT